ncbi:hypothetical protein M7I_5654 [Glarea lozoyensis 74030]|uniref:Uncharacterized protein n=1 Tax=Glarea lozoyensis (strain ATCC 74030 / MF5533) TaxID=1104152 RepID=H0ESG7_GLAL7|nr:hypothetical protein M7I_5654 [Glarea lozoyensis 74030]
MLPLCSFFRLQFSTYTLALSSVSLTLDFQFCGTIFPSKNSGISWIDSEVQIQVA